MAVDEAVVKAQLSQLWQAIGTDNISLLQKVINYVRARELIGLVGGSHQLRDLKSCLPGPGQ